MMDFSVSQLKFFMTVLSFYVKKTKKYGLVTKCLNTQLLVDAE